ncbi:phospholipase effector Tle1 domain-containing protein [Pseudomonas sp. NUPR-001]|uniref:phospholipase effector Tle1 domain-containing protein n=1 Tax=Pseudomonas sp. NUPR-001 TaxID=3416058 RepID=UPI003F9E2D47
MPIPAHMTAAKAESQDDLDQVLVRQATSCPNSTRFPFDEAKDSYERVRARWKLLNCIHQNAKNRKLVVLLDGTANDWEDSTNIWRLYNLALLRSLSPADKKAASPDSHAVIAFYDKGVGTGPTMPISGAALGSGVSMNIRQAYRFLVEAYKPGDKIYLFGFSRGAFTARSLNGFIEYAGLAKFDTITPDTLDDTFMLWWAGNFHSKVNKLYDRYHVSNNGSATFEQTLRDNLRDYRESLGIKAYGDKNPANKVVVQAIGVFDTVPAIGFGLDEDPDGHRLELYARKGYHAMSLDEQRDSFRLQRFATPQYETQTLEEMWFAGAHADIGGGYANGFKGDYCGLQTQQNTGAPVGLEATPLRWMLEKVQAEQIFADSPWPQECLSAPLHDEYFDAAWYLSAIYRNAGLLRRKPVQHDQVHPSVLARMALCDLPEFHPEREPDHRYRPVNLGHNPAAMFTIAEHYPEFTGPCPAPQQ